MARRTSANGEVKKPRWTPTAFEADMLSAQVSSLLLVEANLQKVIDIDVSSLNRYDSPFVHPLYPIMTKLAPMRGKIARNLSAHARALKAEERARKKAQAAA